MPTHGDSHKDERRYMFFLRFSTIAAAFIGLTAQFMFSSVEGSKDPPMYTISFIIGSLIFFLLSFIPPLKKHSYTILLVFASIVTASTALLVAYNNSRIEYIFDLAIAYLVICLFINKKKHLVYYTLITFLPYFVFVTAFHFSGEPQNIFNILLLMLICSVVLFWTYYRIGTQGTVEKMVEQRTEELKVEQNKLRAAISAITGLLVIVDDKGKVILSNHKYGEVLGINYEPQTITEIQQIFGGSYDVSGAYTVAFRQSQVIDHSSIEYKEKFLRVLFAPVYDTDSKTGEKKIIGVLILMGDVTEEELLDRARDEFFAIASHELRTPLTAIQGNLALVLEYIDSGRIEHEKVIDMLQDAMKSSKRLINLVHDFLDISRLEQGRVKFAEQKVDVAKLANEVLLEYDNEIKLKNMTYSLANNAPNVHVFADADRVKQVIVNLVSNAVKYSHQGKVSVTIQPKNNMLEVLVSDTGSGIDPENQKYLFRKFQQAGKNVLSRDTSQGSGLGLYISRLIIRAMGGDVYLVTSEPNKGSTFGFTLPIKN